MHRSTPWWLAIGVTVAVVGTACTSGSGTGKSTSLASAEPAGGTGVSGSALSAGFGATPAAAAVAADVFSCPSAAEINSLTAMGFTSAAGNGAGHCAYVVMTGSTEAVRVTIDHPPASATSAGQTLGQFRAAIVAAGNVVLTAAPQYSTDSFIARFGTLSCSVFALARDGEVMQVQVSHRTPVPTDDCSLAQSVTAVAGTASRSSATASSELPGSDVPASESIASSPAPVPSSEQPSSVPSSTRQSTPATSSTSSTVGTTTPTPPPPATTTPAPTTSAATTPTTPATRKRPTTPSTSSSSSDVLIFSTGPAATFTLPKLRPTTPSR